MSMASLPITRIQDQNSERIQDEIAVEQPTQICIRMPSSHSSDYTTIAITMRTPGNDAELAAGYLFTEGILQNKNQIANITTGENQVIIDIFENIDIDISSLDRRGYANSSCGVCGKTSIDSIYQVSRYAATPGNPLISHSIFNKLSDTVRQAQCDFDKTGGVHASALFDLDGGLITLHEDVGRHNALDKVIGERFLAGMIPLSESVLFLSGRISFELVQKASMAGIPIICAVGAPSTAAVELAKSSNITLVGFLRDTRYNIYCGEERLHA